MSIHLIFNLTREEKEKKKKNHWLWCLCCCIVSPRHVVIGMCFRTKRFSDGSGGGDGFLWINNVKDNESQEDPLFKTHNNSPADRRWFNYSTTDSNIFPKSGKKWLPPPPPASSSYSGFLIKQTDTRRPHDCRCCQTNQASCSWIRRCSLSDVHQPKDLEPGAAVFIETVNDEWVSVYHEHMWHRACCCFWSETVSFGAVCPKSGRESQTFIFTVTLLFSILLQTQSDDFGDVCQKAEKMKLMRWAG